MKIRRLQSPVASLESRCAVIAHLVTLVTLQVVLACANNLPVQAPTAPQDQRKPVGHRSTAPRR